MKKQRGEKSCLSSATLYHVAVSDQLNNMLTRILFEAGELFQSSTYLTGLFTQGVGPGLEFTNAFGVGESSIESSYRERSAETFTCHQ